jgi:hypothetical protein
MQVTKQVQMVTEVTLDADHEIHECALEELLGQSAFAAQMGNLKGTLWYQIGGEFAFVFDNKEDVRHWEPFYEVRYTAEFKRWFVS